MVWNKVDLPKKASASAPYPYEVTLSAKEKTGLDELKESIDRLIWSRGAPPKDQIMITKSRHEEALSNGITALSTVIAGLNEAISPEFLAADVRHALSELGRIVGTNITEDVLSSIFSQFCVGK